MQQGGAIYMNGMGSNPLNPSTLMSTTVSFQNNTAVSWGNKVRVLEGTSVGALVLPPSYHRAHLDMLLCVVDRR